VTTNKHTIIKHCSPRLENTRSKTKM